jgi:hypothetical protein
MHPPSPKNNNAKEEIRLFAALQGILSPFSVSILSRAEAVSA